MFATHRCRDKKLAKPPSKKPSDKIVLDSRKRDEEEFEKIRIAKLNQDELVRTEWEDLSNTRILKARTRREVAALMQCEEFKVNDRREKLRKLLAAEEAGYMEEIVSKEETVIERQAKMRERAKQLKDKREKERLELVQKKYDQQFKNDCEELRSAFTRRREDEALVNNVDMLRMRDEQRKEQQKMDQMYADMWQKDIDEKSAKEERDMLDKMARNRDVLVVQQKQMAALTEQKARENDLKQEEAQLLEEQRALLKLEEQRAKEFKEQRQQATRNMLDSAVGLKVKIAARQQQEELAFDLKALEKLLKDTHDEEIWKRMRKAELRDEDLKYRDHLRYMLELEKQKEKELNDVIQADIDRIDAIKAAKMKQDRETRKRLLTEVITTREQQIQHRLQENAMKQEEAKREREALERQIEVNKMLAQQEVNDLLDKKMGYRSDLYGQMAYSNARLEEETQRDHDEWLSCQRAEEEYQQKIMYLLNNEDKDDYHPTTRAIMDRYYKTHNKELV